MALVVMAGTLAGCLTSNPALTDTSEDSGDDTSTGGGPTSGTPGTSNPSTTENPTSTTDSATTEPSTTVDPDTTDTEDPTTDTETTGPAACGAGSVCVDSAPAGWDGPAIWAETPFEDEVPECPEAYPDPAFEAFDDLQAPPADCDCDCGAAMGASCASLTLEYHANDSNCVGAPEEEFTISAAGSCQAAPNEPSADYWEVTDPGVSGGSCTPTTMESVTPASWVSRTTACGGAVPSDGACDPGQSCVAEPGDGFESRLCVWQPGDLECPDGAYSDRFVRSGDFEDMRACQDCTCGNPTGSCTGTVRLWPDNDCTDSGVAPGPSGIIDIDGGCERGQTATQYGVASANAGTLTLQDVECAPSVGTAIGEAEPVQPYTLCCLSL